MGSLDARARGARARSVSAFCGCLAILGGLSLGGAPAANAATSGWYVATVPGTGGDDILLGTSCADATDCFGSGISISNLGSQSGNPSFAPLVERWDGTGWSIGPTPPLPSGAEGGLFDVSCVGASDCWAVGAVLGQSGSGEPTGTLIDHWNGTSWSFAPTPSLTGSAVVGGILHGVSCASPSQCTAAGFTTDANGNPLHTLVEQWDGATWSVVPTPPTGQAFDQLLGVRCLGASDCWAVGNAGPGQELANFLPIFPGQAPGNQGLIEHWDGMSWSIVPSVNEAAPGGGYLSGIDCVSGTDCWASGALTDGTGQASGILMEHWDGASWGDWSSSVPEPPTSGGAILDGLSCLGASQCWAVGATGPFGGNGGNNFRPRSFVESWNGAGWSVEPSPEVSPLSLLNSVTCLRGAGCTTVGSSAVGIGNGDDPGLRPLVEQMVFPPASSQGMVLASWDGGVFAYGTAAFSGSLGGSHLTVPVVGIAETPDGGGYWLVGSDGGVFAFGDAPFLGSMGGRYLHAPVVGMAPTPDGEGYWLVAGDGGVFAFGDARFAGSMGGHRLNAAVVGMAAAGPGTYWLVGADGGVFAFGRAGFFGSAGTLHLGGAMTGMAATPDGQGYWLVGSDGGVLTYGDAGFEGSVPAQSVVARAPVVGIARTPTGRGYWLAGADGAVYAYGDATFLGAPDARLLARPVSGVAAS